MSRDYFLDLAARRLRMPIGADLILHRQSDPQAVLLDGHRLGRVIEEAAAEFGTPLAFPVMDLKLEKRWLLSALGAEGADIDTHHFSEPPGEDAQAMLAHRLEQGDPPARVQAQLQAIAHIARNTTLYPVGMSIGPFSLASKLLADPITPVFVAGTGATAEDEPEVALLEAALALAGTVVLHSVRLQIDAGARAVFIAEPAANQVFFSPRQLDAGADTFERYALRPNQEVATLLAERNVDHLFHCCGEITDTMLDGFCRLRPVLLSLGSSRRLWEDAARVPRDIVLYGNLPSKRFYSDELTPLDAVSAMADDLDRRMAVTGHPFILGTECDTLHVPGCGGIICGKVGRMLRPGAARILS